MAIAFARVVMRIRLSLRNYRAFSDEAVFEIGSGFTAFIGVNNSGKSSLLKACYELRPLLQQLADGNRLRSLLTQANQGLPTILGVQDPEEIFCNSNAESLVLKLSVLEPLPERSALPLPDFLEVTISRARSWSAKLVVGGRPLNSPAFPGGGDTVINSPGSVGLAQLGPIREAASVLARSTFVGPFRNAIAAQGESSYFDLRVGRAVASFWKTQKSGSNLADRTRALQLEREIESLFNLDDLRIDPSEDGTMLLVSFGGRSYRLEELGSGLAEFVVVLMEANHQRPGILFIDEPESHLHPSLQLAFLGVLAGRAEHGVAFATHSVGLARAIQARSYAVRVESDGSRSLKPLDLLPDLKAFLGELNFTGFKALGYGKILLVEGETDVATVLAIMRRYNLDGRILPLPLRGSTLISPGTAAEIGELKGYCQEVKALIDSERDSAAAPLDANRQAFVETCRSLTIPCHVMERRAIENYFPQRAIDKAFGGGKRALAEFERRGSASWPKSDNWRVANEMTRSEWEPTDLGAFFSSLG